jgi:nitrogen fixation-related uncharacterized protein
MAIFGAVILLSLAVMAICLPLTFVFLWISGQYDDATHHFRMAKLHYLAHNIQAGDQEAEVGKAVKAKADRWAQRFHVGKST